MVGPLKKMELSFNALSRHAMRGIAKHFDQLEELNATWIRRLNVDSTLSTLEGSLSQLRQIEVEEKCFSLENLAALYQKRPQLTVVIKGKTHSNEEKENLIKEVAAGTTKSLSLKKVSSDNSRDTWLAQSAQVTKLECIGNLDVFGFKRLQEIINQLPNLKELILDRVWSSTSMFDAGELGNSILQTRPEMKIHSSLMSESRVYFYSFLR